MSVSVFAVLPQAFSTSATALGSRFSSMSQIVATLTLGKLAKPSANAPPRERIPITATLTVSFGLERVHSGTKPGRTNDPAVNPAAPVCLTNWRRLIEFIASLLVIEELSLDLI